MSRMISVVGDDNVRRNMTGLNIASREAMKNSQVIDCAVLASFDTALGQFAPSPPSASWLPSPSSWWPPATAAQSSRLSIPSWPHSHKSYMISALVVRAWRWIIYVLRLIEYSSYVVHTGYWFVTLYTHISQHLFVASGSRGPENMFSH